MRDAPNGGVADSTEDISQGFEWIGDVAEARQVRIKHVEERSLEGYKNKNARQLRKLMSSVKLLAGA